MKQRFDELESIPGIGPRIAQKLRLIGVNKVSDFKNKDPERLYNKLEQTIGAHVDRCVLTSSGRPSISQITNGTIQRK
jgi:nucleotidyltransferase/DNA polymerase involved in DNA repair